MDKSCVVRALDFQQPWFKQRAAELDEPMKLHRKLWEYCMITQVFEEQVREGYAIGFGVGREPIAAWLANRYIEVMATDRPDLTKEWSETGQHARVVSDLIHEKVCSLKRFHGHVHFDAVDMNDIPIHLKREQFDFSWSCGAFEHLGSIEHGLRFFLEQMKCLRKGGIAAHTTEFNPEKGETLDDVNIALFQERHLKDLEQRLEKQGDRLWPLDLTPGTDLADVRIDREPYGLPHLRLKVGSWTTTSVLLVAQRGAY